MAETSLEETQAFRPRFGADGLIPVAVTETGSRALLMLAYMNAEALDRTLATGQAWYWSRSRKALWRKGETSGHTQSVVEVRIDCDQDAIELVVRQSGPACHTGRKRCFYRVVTADDGVRRLEFSEE